MTSANNRATQRNKILIVDDDPEVRGLLRDLVLSPSLFEVHEAEDGASGLQQVRAIAPDMILLDLVMPDLSGNDFLVALRQQDRTRAEELFSKCVALAPKSCVAQECRQ